MARSNAVRTLGGTVLVFALIGLAAWIHRLGDRAFLTPVVPRDSLYVTGGHTISRLALGYSALVADVYWMRAIQYLRAYKNRSRSGAPSRRLGQRRPFL